MIPTQQRKTYFNLFMYMLRWIHDTCELHIDKVFKLYIATIHMGFLDKFEFHMEYIKVDPLKSKTWADFKIITHKAAPIRIQTTK